MKSESSSYERQRVGQAHLPRLAPEFYRGDAFVFWTLNIKDRKTGWLTPAWYHAWQLTLVHMCARYELACPCFVLMPDHAHLLLFGINPLESDQRVAIEFFRKQLSPGLAPAEWQHQTHDRVLRAPARERGAVQSSAHYIFENPVRAGLVPKWEDYSYTGCCIVGYPEFNIRADDYWERFWRCYQYVVSKVAG